MADSDALGSSSADMILDEDAAEDIARNKALVVSRLAQKGVHVTEAEDADELASLLEVVERFETAVIARGGDLMMDEAPLGSEPQPDDHRFVLPVRGFGEGIGTFSDRIVDAMPTDDGAGDAGATVASDGSGG